MQIGRDIFTASLVLHDQLGEGRVCTKLHCRKWVFCVPHIITGNNSAYKGIIIIHFVIISKPSWNEEECNDTTCDTPIYRGG